jgi:predicted transcriptional regulator of viral defense system
MKTIELIDKLRSKTVFNLSDIERITNASRNYSKLIIARLLKRKLIKKISFNRYTTKTNQFVIASNLIYPSYISFWSASHYKKYTEQMPKTIQLACTIRKRPIKYDGYTIEFISLKDFFGYKKEATSEGEVFIAEDEKLLLDSLLNWKKMGNFDEIIQIFINSEISKEKMVFYLKRTGNQSLIKRVGFLLEKYKSLDISQNFKLDRNYIILNPFSNKIKEISKKWRVKHDY